MKQNNTDILLRICKGHAITLDLVDSGISSYIGHVVTTEQMIEVYAMRSLYNPIRLQ